MPIHTVRDLLDRRRTKIVATLGPASSSSEVLGGLVQAGVNVFRLNLSHGDSSSHEMLCRTVRELSKEAGRPIGILADLPGPKLRVGCFKDGFTQLDTGSGVVVTTRDVLGEPGLIPSQYPGLAQDLSAGNTILLDDGRIELEVVGVSGTEIACKVVVGGPISDKKGMNLPGASVSAAALTQRDEELARFALELGVDFLALSFVRRASDLQALRRILKEASSDTLVIAKIERAEALDRIEEILSEADGIMVARGDLGVELPPEKVPLVQGQLVELAQEWEKPAIVATQMLESMTHGPRPTRAEVMDVSHAVTQWTDAVMLSGETAVGQHPIRAAQMMDRIIRETEGFLWEGRKASDWTIPNNGKAPPLGLEDAVARATAQLTRDLDVRCIVVFTASGWTAGKVSAARPQAPILAATPSPRAWHRTSLFWGVEPIAVDSLEPGQNHGVTKRLALDSGLAKEGDYVLEVRGFSSDPERNIPTLAVCRL